MTKKVCPGTKITFVDESGKVQTRNVRLHYPGARVLHEAVRPSRDDEFVHRKTDCDCVRRQASPEEILMGEPDPRFQMIGECCGIEAVEEEMDSSGDDHDRADNTLVRMFRSLSGSDHELPSDPPVSEIESAPVSFVGMKKSTIGPSRQYGFIGSRGDVSPRNQGKKRKLLKAHRQTIRGGGN